MVLLSEPSDSICQYRIVLVLLYLLLQPSELLAVTCDKCGFSYDSEDFTFCPIPSCNMRDKDLPSQHDTSLSQSAIPVNDDSSHDVQADEHLNGRSFNTRWF
ncbi:MULTISPECIES: hypothetical protein [unclassified Endozoicomonas]|uniref:hypothetical protein n=1 Tax=unclassified Endozoicomonas TaxID=2644528 RepID=UPI0021476906|nr:MULTISPECIES: hypothetical protein [unclassified Endozoicomonas]